MVKKTFDLIDAPLEDAYGHYQTLDDDIRFTCYRRTFLIDPLSWKKYKPKNFIFKLNWREYRYADIQQREDLDRVIPENDPGIYVFYTRPNQLIYRFPQFAFYIGISNERDSQRPLRERLKDYLPTALSTIRKRKNIHRMLQLYYENIWVAFALSSAASRELVKIEEDLHGFICPCFGRRHFPVKIKRQQQAFGEI